MHCTDCPVVLIALQYSVMGYHVCSTVQQLCGLPVLLVYSTGVALLVCSTSTAGCDIISCARVLQASSTHDFRLH